MSTDHEAFHYSVTCETDDRAVLACLRALCHISEHAKKAQIGWGGSGEDAWESNGHQVTFRFTQERYRDAFVAEANRLLPGHWKIRGTDDRDPATPRRRR